MLETHVQHSDNYTLDILFYKKEIEIKKKRFSAILTKSTGVAFSLLLAYYVSMLFRFTFLHIGVGQMTIDWLARNVYWTDSGYGWIAMKSFPESIATVNSLDRSFRVIVDTFLDVPTGIIVSPTK